MLYFTFAEGSTKGIFSGRFAFKVHQPDEGDPEALKANIERLSVEHLGATLIHEKAHHSASARSDICRCLIGQRFYARVAFAMGADDYIRRYYQRRTVYFALVYAFHERLVDRMLARAKRRIVAPTEIGQEKTVVATTKLEEQAVRRLDRLVNALPVRCAPGPWRRWSSPANFLGYLACRDFGVILAYTTGEGQFTLREASAKDGFGGVFNAAFQPTARDTRVVRIIKSLHRLLNIEGVASRLGKPLSGERTSRWVELKLQAEYDTIVLLFHWVTALRKGSRPQRMVAQVTAAHASPNEFFRSYIAAILPFALKFQGESAALIWSDTELLVDQLCAAVQRRDFSTLSPRQKELVSKTAGFFFYHGN